METLIRSRSSSPTDRGALRPHEAGNYPVGVRKYMLLLSAIVVTASSVLGPVTAAGAVAKLSDVDVSRYGGADRYATSLRIAEAVAMDAGGSLD